jgi:peptidoglycan/LPS O-acetylase OafA/YrhL
MPPDSTPNPTKRIAELDGLRGVAISLVVLFHCYARWGDRIPWATTHANFPPFHYGYLGVELFFMISGYVILMSLERCQTFPEFIWKRWLRLFPSMLIASAIIFTSASLLPERPSGAPALPHLLPGIFFIEPGYINKLTGLSTVVLEGGFWSLFVEVKFYFLFGIIYFTNKRWATTVLFALVALIYAHELASQLIANHNIYFLSKIISLISGRYLGWFAIGAMLLESQKNGGRRKLALTALLVLPSSAVSVGASAGTLFGCAALYVLFILALTKSSVARVVDYKPLLFMGYISYPLYLIHENAMVATTIKTHGWVPWLPGELTPIPGMALLIGVAYVIARYGEPAMRKQLDQIGKACKRLFPH